MKTFRALLITAALFGTSFALHSEPASHMVSGVNAIVHDSVITFQEVDIFAAPAVDVAKRQFRGDYDGFNKKVNDLRGESLDQLVQRQLVLHDFEASGYNLPESIIDEAVKDRVRERYGDQRTLAKTLQAQGITRERFRQQMREQIIVEALRSKNVSSEVIISPRKIEKYYNEHATNYAVEDQVKLRMIVLNKSADKDEKARQLADEIVAKLKDGAKFTEMASVYSQGSQRAQQGDWGWGTRSSLKKELADVAFTLKAGEVSPVIETPTAIFIMLVEEIKPAHMRPLNEARDEIEKNLLVDERARLDRQYTDKLKKKTFVRYF
jgi:peptidyl-prolyl cis-trans isomerase SurA